MNAYQLQGRNLSKFYLLFFSFTFPFLLFGQECLPEGNQSGDDVRISYTSVMGPDGFPEYQFVVCGKPDLGELLDEFIPDMAQYGYLWDFGDGTYSNEPSPRHRYITPASYYPKVYLVKRYVSSDKGRSVLRTSRPLTGEGDKLEIVAPDPGTTVRSGADGYQLVPPPTPVDFEPAFDLVPAYLQVFVMTFENTCGGTGAREVKFAIPKGVFSLDSLAIFFQEGGGGAPDTAFIPANSPPEEGQMVSPLSNLSGDYSPAPIPGPGLEADTIKFFVNFSSPATQYVHVLLNLYTSPFLKTGGELSFNLQIANCPGQGQRGSSTNLDKSFPVSSSHDPNYKYVGSEAPASGKNAYITGSQPEKLFYRIAFQNEGNASEHDIIIRDTLSSALDFNTFKLLNIELAGTIEPHNICDYPPIWRDQLWNSSNPDESYYKLSRDPVTREIKIELKTLLWGSKMVADAVTNWEGIQIEKGDTLPEEWSWGYIDFEIFTDCSINENGARQLQFVNKAGIIFGEQDPLMTDEVSITRICYNNKTYVYSGQNFDLDLVRIASSFYPNVAFDYRTAVITHSRAGIAYPTSTRNFNGSEYRYIPNRSRYSKLDTAQVINRKNANKVLVDNLRYTICDTFSKRCYPVSIFVLISPDSLDSIQEYDCDGNCTPAPAVTDPYPCWWYWLAAIILLLLILISLLRRRRSRRR